MRIETKPAPKEFKPVSVTITFDTREELIEMYVRHCVADHKIREWVNGSTIHSVPVDEAKSAIGSHVRCVVDALRPLVVESK